MEHSGYRVDECIRLEVFFTMFECVRSGGYEFSGETHDFWECVYVKKGKVCISADERVYDMGSGQMIFHKPMELHKYYVSENESAELFIFSFSARGNLMSFFKNKVFDLNDAQRKIICNLLDFLREKTDTKVSETTEKPFGFLESIKHSPVYMETVGTYIQSLFLSICDSNEVSMELDTESARVFKQAVNYMSEHTDRALKVSDIAEICCISPTGLKKIFAQYAGLGVHKYFLKMKINLATSLIEQGLSVTEVGDRLGFSGQAYFSAAYKRETGKSPSEIRRQ